MNIRYGDKADNMPQKTIEDLANEIIVMAVRDYRSNPIDYGKEIKDFLYGDWFKKLTTVNGPALFDTLYKEVMAKEMEKQKDQKTQNMIIILEDGKVKSVCGTVCNVNIEVIDLSDTTKSGMKKRSKLKDTDVLYPFRYLPNEDNVM